MRVASLRDIGGYSRDFWLDLSDIYVFRAMYSNGSNLYVAGDLVLEHSVTNMNFDHDMAPPATSTSWRQRARLSIVFFKSRTGFPSR